MVVGNRKGTELVVLGTSVGCIDVDIFLAMPPAASAVGSHRVAEHRTQCDASSDEKERQFAHFEGIMSGSQVPGEIIGF